MYFTFLDRRKKSRRVLLLLSLTLLSGFGDLSPVKAQALPKVEYGMYTVMGKKVKLPHADIRIDSTKLIAGKGEVPPIILNDRTVVPVRMISERMGATVEWNEMAEEVMLRRQDKNIVLKIGSPSAKVNGIPKELPDKVAPIIVNGRTMLPIRFLADEFGMKIHYDAPSNSIDLMTSETSNPIFEKSLSEEEKQAILQQVEVGPGMENTNHLPIFEPLPGSPSIISPQHPTQPTMPIITTPIPPIVPGVPQPSNKLEALPSKVPANADQLRSLSYELEQRSLTHERFVIKKGSGLKFQSFYLKDPERLVVDIQDGYLDPLFEQNRIYANSSFITQMNSFFHSEDNRLRLTFPLKEEIDRKEITVGKNTQDIVIEYKSSKPQNANMQYKADRVHADFELRMVSSYPVTDIISDPSGQTIEFTVPYEKSNLIDETREIKDNIIRKMEVTKIEENVRVVLYLKDRISYRVVDNGASAKLHLKFKKKKREIPMILIDPGHGAHDPGAVAKSTGMTEKALNLMISRKVQDRLLLEGYDVLMTRETDIYPKVPDRAVQANENEVDLFVSIHNNAAANPATSGLEVLYYPTPDNKVVADIFRAEIIKTSAAVDRGLRKRPDLIVLNSTKVPAVLLELGYMTNAAELAKLSDDSYQELLADGIVSAIKQYVQSPDE